MRIIKITRAISVMNDDYRKELENKPLKIKFLGYKNEQVVIEEAFIVSADECRLICWLMETIASFCHYR